MPLSNVLPTPCSETIASGTVLPAAADALAELEAARAAAWASIYFAVSSFLRSMPTPLFTNSVVYVCVTSIPSGTTPASTILS